MAPPIIWAFEDSTRATLLRLGQSCKDKLSLTPKTFHNSSSHLFYSILAIVLPGKGYLLRGYFWIWNFYLYLMLAYMREAKMRTRLWNWLSGCIGNRGPFICIFVCICVWFCVCICLCVCVCVLYERSNDDGKGCNGSECLAALAMEELCICLSPLFTSNLLPLPVPTWWCW